MKKMWVSRLSWLFLCRTENERHFLLCFCIKAHLLKFWFLCGLLISFSFVYLFPWFLAAESLNELDSPFKTDIPTAAPLVGQAQAALDSEPSEGAGSQVKGQAGKLEVKEVLVNSPPSRGLSSGAAGKSLQREIVPGRFVNQIVAQVGGADFLTSREVLASFILEEWMYKEGGRKVSSRENKKDSFYLSGQEKIEAPNLYVLQDLAKKEPWQITSAEVASALMEKIIALEAESFAVANIDPAEKEKYLKLIGRLSKQSELQQTWRDLGMEQNEVDELVLRKMRAKKFIHYKMESSAIFIGEEEAQAFFNKNRYKFGQLPFANFKSSIQKFLADKKSQESLAEWFELLKRKYRIRNLLTGA